MKTLGLIGGMSWESTTLYYQSINREIGARLGKLHSAKLLINSVDFQEIVELQRADRWEDAGALLAGEAKRLERAGAEVIALAVNTMHKVAPAIREKCPLALIDIRSAVAAEIQRLGLRRVALLGTRFVTEQAFYKERVAEEAGCAVVTPDANDRLFLHEIIYNELSKGLVLSQTQKQVTEIIRNLCAAGADGIVLACTELPMLSLQPLVPFAQLIDSTAIHVRACVNTMLE